LLQEKATDGATKPTAIRKTATDSPAEVNDGINPETVQKPADAKPDSMPKANNTLLVEQTITNKEQRKADWAIMKEMARYLWPKVGGSV
jgi:ABC transporter ATM